MKYKIYRLKYLFGKHLFLNSPVDVSLELASSCNMKCNYCYHSDPKSLPFDREIMPLDVAYKIISESADLGVNSLKFNWKGESTLNPHFNELTRYAKHLASGSVFIDRLTNSNFKFQTSRDDIFEGLCNQTKVKVSFDSFDKDVFEKQRAGGIHRITMANIDKFYHHPKRKDTKLIIQAVRTQLNKDEDIEEKAKKLWPEAEISIRDMVAGRVDKDLDEYEDKQRDFSDRQSCLQAHVRVIFNAKGEAFPCCPDVAEELWIGNINHTSLKEIFNSRLVRQLRKDLKNKSAFKYDPCRKCSSFESFKGYKSNFDS